MILCCVVAFEGGFSYNDAANCPGGLMDKAAVSGAADTGSIPVRDAIEVAVRACCSGGFTFCLVKITPYMSE